MKSAEFYKYTNADIFRRDARYAGINIPRFDPTSSYEDLVKEQLFKTPNSVIELLLTSFLILGGFAVVALACVAGAILRIAVIALPVVILTLAAKWVLIFLGVALPNEVISPWEFLGLSFGVFAALAAGVVILVEAITPAPTSFTGFIVSLPFRMAEWGIVACTAISLLIP